MTNKLTALLLHLSTYEHNALRKYLASPFFNENAIILQYYDELMQKQKTSKKKGFNIIPEKIWSTLFPTQAFNDVKWRRLNSDLNQLVLDFLAIRAFQRRPLLKENILMQAVNEPALQKHFMGIVRRMRITLKKSPLRNADYHYHQFQTESICHTHIEKTNATRNDLENLEKADHHLDHYYIAKKLKHYCDTLGYKNLRNKEFSVFLFKDFTQQIEASDFVESPIINTYFHVYKLLNNPEDDTHFYTIKKLLITNAHLFDRKEVSTIYIHLLNYCIDEKILKGVSRFYNELFLIYVDMIESTIILEDGVLAESHYKNIITLGLRLDKYDWTQSFIEEYSQKLLPESRENCYAYHMALLHYYKQNYSSVIPLLQGIGYSDIKYALAAKTLLAMTYCWQEEDFALESTLENFRIFLLRNRQIHKNIKAHHSNFIKFAKKLMYAYSPNKNKRGLIKLKEQVENCKNLTGRNLLLERITFLME